MDSDVVCRFCGASFPPWSTKRCMSGYDILHEHMYYYHNRKWIDVVEWAREGDTNTSRHKSEAVA